MLALQHLVANKLHRECQQPRERRDDDYMAQENGAGDCGPIAERRGSRAERLTVRQDEPETDDALERRLERAECRRSPRPLAQGKAAEVNRCHEEHERRCEEKHRAEVQPARAGMCENHRAVKTNDDAGDEGHLDDGPGELAERGRLADGETGGEALPQSLAVLARDEVCHCGPM